MLLSSSLPHLCFGPNIIEGLLLMDQLFPMTPISHRSQYLYLCLVRGHGIMIMENNTNSYNTSFH
jgi:hypothetical protein